MMIENLEKMREFFNSDITKDVNFRIRQLKKLQKTYKKYEPFIVRALKSDLKKPNYEIYSMEFKSVLEETEYTIHNLRKWSKPENIWLESKIKPNKGKIIKEPFGIVLITGAFNYPFELTFRPLIGALAAGNCAVVKPSRKAGQSFKIIQTIINEAFDKSYVFTADEDPISLLENKFDYIFYTGSSEYGKKIMEKAAKNLTPMTLELGGKSPAIISKKANLDNAVKKIVWGKFVNAGQTCIAPDYVLIPEDLKESFSKKIRDVIRKFYSIDPQTSASFGRIINEKAFIQISSLIEYDKLIYGGKTDECGLYIEPTVQWCNSFDDNIMQKEIFGPVLPVLTYKKLEDVIKILKTKEKPLSLYFFSQCKKEAEIMLTSLSFGSGCINDCMRQSSSLKLPFGGIGLSGLGQYHGKFSFDTFSHKKSIIMGFHNKYQDDCFPPYKI